MTVLRRCALILTAAGLGLAACGPAPAPAATPVPQPATAVPAASQPPASAAAATPTAGAATPQAAATAAPPDFDPQAYTLQLAAQGLDQPVYLTHAGDERLFVLEQPGRIRIVRAGQPDPTPFLDLTDRVGSDANEQGLLGLAFDPAYADNGVFYVDYTDRGGNTVVARYSVTADPDRADPASERVVLRVEQPYENHNGGQLAFGPDGYLYIGLGDGGSAGDPENRAQNLGTLLGKLLRLDVRSADGPYQVPADNPFVGTAGARPEIWAYGLRNPWRFSFDARTGDLYVGDVGQDTIEEIDFQPAGSPGGQNYGWRLYEASQPYQDAGSAPAGLVPPVAEYTHAEGGCSVTGGYVYRGAALPALDGVYLFADYCTGRVWSLRRGASGAWQRQDFAQAGVQVSSFGQDAAGELYLLYREGGQVFRLAARP